MKERYEVAEMEVVEFEVEDVIRTSSNETTGNELKPLPPDD